VARHLDRQYHSGAPSVLRVLVEAYRHGERGRELQACLAHFDLPDMLLPGLVAMMRVHRPSLRLPASSRAALRSLRGTHRIGVVTNGIPSTQTNKVKALGLRPLVDAVIYAAEHGTGLGKPDTAPFLAALSRLEVAPSRAVFVGDDELSDVGGAAAAGLRTVRLERAGAGATGGSAADVTVHSLAEVPGVIDTLIGPAWSRDVA
jgi:putative hydrolase of the HAD superfamily